MASMIDPSVGCRLGVPPEISEKFQLFDETRKLVAVAHVDRNKVIYDRVFAP